jgi:hypothetical protein
MLTPALVVAAALLAAATATSAGTVCGQASAPRLEMLASYDGTDKPQDSHGGGTYALIVFPPNVVYQVYVGTDLPLGLQGVELPFVAGSFCFQATPVAISTLDAAMVHMRIGAQSDCSLDDANILPPSANEYRFRWHGAKGRSNVFRVTSRPAVPACPAEVQEFLNAINSLGNDASLFNQFSVSF